MAVDEPMPTTGVAGADTDPNTRVHHHARLDDRRQATGGPIVTLCGLALAGPRPDAASLPCCPMCADRMEAAGRRCR